MPRLSTREMCLAAGCLVNANGMWKRAVVINCSRSDIGFDIKLIDTGEYNEILDGVSLFNEILQKLITNLKKKKKKKKEKQKNKGRCD